MSNRFGIREVCNCYFKRESGIGPEQFVIDTSSVLNLVAEHLLGGDIAPDYNELVKMYHDDLLKLVWGKIWTY